jgi:polyketide biosynthesis enoyl-CoA hydratase PksI
MNAPIRLSREGNVAIVALEDRESKNSFSRPFVEGIERVFREIAASADLRAVVVHGYDNYFCCGGTKDELIGLSKSVSNEGATAPISLDDLMFFDLFLRCEVPVTRWGASRTSS